jgi:hypothetical protein
MRRAADFQYYYEIPLQWILQLLPFATLSFTLVKVHSPAGRELGKGTGTSGKGKDPSA